MHEGTVGPPARRFHRFGPLREHTLDFRAIEIFLAVCDEGSLSAAARRLGITQAAVSQRLAQLERDTGAHLIDRSARPPRLLPAGAHLRQTGKRLLAEADELRHSLNRFRDAEIPELRVGILESLALALVPRLVPELRKLVGTLAVTSGITGPLVPELLHGDLDIILTSERLDTLHDIEAHMLVREPFIVAVPDGYDLPQEPDDLLRLSRKLTFVRYGARRRMSRLIDQQLERSGVKLPRTLEFASSAPVIDLVRQGLAFAIITPLCLSTTARLRPGDLKVGPLPWIAYFRQIELASPAERLLDLPDRVAKLCCHILETDVLPSVFRLAPFVEDLVTIGETAPRSEIDPSVTPLRGRGGSPERP